MWLDALESKQTNNQVLNKEDLILEEIKLLREQVMLLLPQEDLDDYAHPRRIKKSYDKAVKQYPPLSK